MTTPATSLRGSGLPASASVSVVIPAYQAERFLGPALDSVVAQSCPAWEVIVVDDGSSDGTVDVVAAFPTVRLLRRPHRGIGATRNAGVAASSGELVAFLDADDLWRPRKLELQLAIFAESPGTDIVFGLLDEFVDDTLPGEDPRPAPCPPGMLVPGHVSITCMLRRGCFDIVGTFREDLGGGEFIDWMARALDLGMQMTTIDSHVASRRTHATNHTRDRSGATAALPRVLKASLDRRRHTTS